MIWGWRQDSGNRGFDDGRWKRGGWDVLKSNVLPKIVSKVLVDEGVLGGRRKEVFLLVFAIGKFVGRDVGKDVKTVDGSRGDGGTGNDIGGAIQDIEEGVIFRVVKDGPGKLRGWGMWDRDNG